MVLAPHLSPAVSADRYKEGQYLHGGGWHAVIGIGHHPLWRAAAARPCFDCAVLSEGSFCRGCQTHAQAGAGACMHD